jgi:hypothetical protein
MPGRPDRRRVPGAVCVRGYSSSVRPPVSYTGPLKRRLMAAYGDKDSPANYELDHRISISLGGDPRAVSNLWPEIGPSTNSKDRTEFELYDALCSGRITLEQAQQLVLAWPGDR